MELGGPSRGLVGLSNACISAWRPVSVPGGLYQRLESVPGAEFGAVTSEAWQSGLRCRCGRQFLGSLLLQ